MRFVKNLCWLQIKLLHRIHKESKRHHVRQRAHCILLSYQGYQVNELAKIFGKKDSLPDTFSSSRLETTGISIEL